MSLSVYPKESMTKTAPFICEYDNAAGIDAFGHKMLAGCGKYLENLVRSRLGVKARSVELNVSQRCSGSMLSETDQQEAILAGEFGVQAALNGRNRQNDRLQTPEQRAVLHEMYS